MNNPGFGGALITTAPRNMDMVTNTRNDGWKPVGDQRTDLSGMVS